MARNVVVTGGGSGIGLAIAERFAAAGYGVHLFEIDEGVLADALGSNPGFTGSRGDVASPDQVVGGMREALEARGQIDVLVNNAGIAGPHAALEDMSDEEWDRTIRVNLYGMFNWIKQVLPAMKERRDGAIVNISTGSIRTIPVDRSVYNVSKAAVEGLTRTVAREVGPHNVRVNAIQPGMVNNARMEGIVRRIADQSDRTPREVEEDFLRFISMRTKIEPEEIADMAVFLASDQASHVTGQVIAVDGLIEWEQ